jgi:transposase InsO family protein
MHVRELLTDNESAHRSAVHAIACRTLGIRHLRTRPRRPQTNGKAARFIRTMLGGWAYGAIYASAPNAQLPLGDGCGPITIGGDIRPSGDRHPSVA